ncbi:MULTISPECIES: LLM class flavin-dependent oxidoreductase [Kitasatospora]|uniref:LLM class flavin-dependent oxidoreductase n=1 Tax=Kitasatospora TaxID=2063 RepID=UPI000C70FC5C|nr:LLM class flavin-dependent oxidoreductase [Kitasatospora sp. GP30]MDH6142144.1 alkanesulfonate monooxygenase SsuD/methylene tetrahydromethanopterin reductase-like flavin-dependent oxidoreductase (luciferase family) [Kitasatospora sp. GP30]
MQLGVNVPNFGPGTDPGVLREWARIAEGLGYDLLMVSDHVVGTPDVAQRYPDPFYEPFTTLSWLAGVTSTVRLGTTVLILPYRHPLLVARMATSLSRLSGGRFVLGVGVGWARQEFDALGVPFTARGRLTDEYLATLREVWRTETEQGAAPIPVWVGGHSAAALRRAARFGDAWHPLRLSVARMRTILTDHALPMFAPRIALRVTETPVDDAERIAGVGTIEQILDDLRQLHLLGADTVVLDPYHGDPEATRRPHTAWRALTEVATHWKTAA